ncbi:MAG: molybdenum cofactor guanylyltransferase [Bacteroidota bacterium]|nr:molybdenum cofactor guanylyltransferase [Bacteroidota bacterium]
MKQKTTGIILSGGKSSRMGSDKGLLVFHGKPLIQYAIDVLKELCDEIIICANNPAYDIFGFPVIKDVYPDLGPIGGIYTGLLNSGTESNFVLSCDMPFINPQTIIHLLSKREKTLASIPIHSKNMIEPLCALYSKTILPQLTKQIRNKDLKLMNLLKTVDINWVKMDSGFEFYHPDLFFNVNDQDSLKIAETIMRKA